MLVTENIDFRNKIPRCKYVLKLLHEARRCTAPQLNVSKLTGILFLLSHKSAGTTDVNLRRFSFAFEGSNKSFRMILRFS